MPGYGIYNKLLRFDRTPEESHDAAYEQVIEEAVAGLEVLPRGSILKETKAAGNTWTLGGGVYPSFSHGASGNVIRGVAANSIISRSCRINAHSSVFGVTFTDAMEPDATELVRVGPGAAVSFVGCIFRREGTSAGSMVYVSDQGGGVVDPAVVFVGCTFINGGTTTIDNATGVVTKVQVIGCVNRTPNVSLGSVTEIGTVRVA